MKLTAFKYQHEYNKREQIKPEPLSILAAFNYKCFTGRDEILRNFIMCTTVLY